MRAFLKFLVVAILAAGGWLAWVVWMPVTPSGNVSVLLRPGFSTRRIATELQNAGVIRNRYAFVLLHHVLRRKTLKAGEYLFVKPANAVEVYGRLERGDINFHTVVIPEGYTVFDIAQAIEDSGLGTKQEFLDVALHDTSLIRDMAPEATTLEGYLFPNTYEFTRTESMKDVAEAMVKQFRQVAKEVGLESNVQSTVTMASIVEKETRVADERPLVASVYYNRLSDRIALQADPTVIYAELLLGTYSGKLHHADLQVKSGYNTYLHPGLPPGPIGNPGRASLEAAMHPAQSNYLFFVADGNGQHRFARSLEEHNRNVNAYRKAMIGR